MAGFETRAIWGSDPGLVSDRFRYTGVSVPPLDEEAIKRIQQQASSFLKSTINPFEKTSLPFLGSLATNQLNLAGENPFKAAKARAEEE